MSPPRADVPHFLIPVAAERGSLLPNVVGFLQSDEPNEVCAALVAARQSDPSLHFYAVEHLTESAHPGVRDAALITALAWGSQTAFQRVLALGFDSTTVNPLPMLLTAILGGPSHAQRLAQLLEKPAHRKAALYALGYSGHVPIVERILPYVASPEPSVAKLAAEGLVTITGMVVGASEASIAPTPEEDALPPLEEDDLDADLVPVAEDALPHLSPKALTTAWIALAPSIDPQFRVLGGKRWTLARSLEWLRGAPLRQRHAVARWLQIRSGGSVRADTRSFGSLQLAQLSRFATAPEQTLIHRFGNS